MNKSELVILLGKYKDNMSTLATVNESEIFECMLVMRTLDMYSANFLCDLADTFLTNERKTLMKLDYTNQLSLEGWFALMKKYSPNITHMAALTKEALRKEVVEQSARIICDTCEKGLNEQMAKGLLEKKDCQMFFNSCCIE